MVDPILEAFGVAPAANLDLLVEGQRLADLTARSVSGIDRLLRADPCDALIVQGDTTTAFGAALAAFSQQVPVVHVEAGLRTGDVTAPFPEEMNRRLITQLAALNLAPTRIAAENLKREGVADDRVVITGNTVIDALHWAVAKASPPSDPALTAIEQDERSLVLVTAHRREAWDGGLAAAAEGIAEFARTSDALVVVPLHRNPIVRSALVPILGKIDNVRLVEPLDYMPFCRLMARSALIITDSGGIQEEAPSLGVPVIVLRDVTERPEAVDAGAAVIVGTDPKRIVAEAARALRGEKFDRQTRNLYGDGAAAVRSVDALTWFFGDGPRPSDFSPSDD
jgi:UDP-N-acetylglucosamine 2-epimerase (non-hydrolysing)